MIFTAGKETERNRNQKETGKQQKGTERNRKYQKVTESNRK